MPSVARGRAPGGRARRRSQPRAPGRGLGLAQLEAVAERVVDERALDARDRAVALRARATRFEAREQPGEVVDDEAGMGLLRGAEWVLDADVQLLGSHAKPAAVGIRQGRRPRDLLEPEQLAVERARLCLAVRRRRDLHVIDAENPHAGVLSLPGATIRCVTRKQLRDFCLSFPGAVEEFPFGAGTHVYKARAKIFAISAMDSPLKVSLK